MRKERKLQLIALNLSAIKGIAAKNWSFHFSQINCIFLVYLLWKVGKHRIKVWLCKWFYLIRYDMSDGI